MAEAPVSRTASLVVLGGPWAPCVVWEAMAAGVFALALKMSTSRSLEEGRRDCLDI